MDVNRYEQDVAALTPGHVVSDAQFERRRSLLRQRHAVYLDGSAWNASSATSPPTQVMWGPRPKLPRIQFPQCLSRRRSAFAPQPTSIAQGNVTGGFGVENVSHRHRPLHLSRAANLALRHHRPRRPGHPGKLHLEQIHRRHQPGHRRHRLYGRRSFRLLRIPSTPTRKKVRRRST